MLVATEGGVTFWTGNHPLAVGDGDLAANPQLKIASQALKNAHPDLTEEQMEPIYYREALAWMRAHPIDWLALEARKVVYLVVPMGPSYRLHSWRYFIASAGTVPAVASGGSRRRVAPWRRPRAASGSVAAPRGRDRDLSDIFPAGALQDSCHRSRADHLCGRPVGDRT